MKHFEWRRLLLPLGLWTLLVLFFSTRTERALVSKKVAAGQTETVTPLEETPSAAGTGNVLDLTALLAASLAKRKPASGAARSEGRGAVAARKAAAKVAPKKQA